MKLNVEHVMSQVRAEVVRRGGAFAINEEQLDTGGDFPFWRPAVPQVEIKPAYRLSELLRYSDRAFVENAYLAVLRRLPDPEGNALYLSRLRDGVMTKVEVLASLRWSKEGELRGVHVDGLLIPTVLQRWKRKRLVGRVVRWAASVFHMSDFADRAKEIEATQAAEIQDLGRLVNALSHQVQTRLVRIEEQGHDWSEEGKLSSLEMAGHLDALRLQVTDIEARITGELAGLQSKVASQDAAIEALRLEVASQRTSLARLPAANIQDHSLDPMYVAFEEAFRGSTQLIRERAMPYIAIIQDAGAGTPEAPVLDLGCGRGDWLDLLREHGLVARGVDSNRVFLGMCAARGLDVIEGDVIEVLKTLPDSSFGAITGMHIAEHLPFDVLIRMLDECRRVLVPGGVLALETPNPENPWVGSHFFYMDPTHRNPIPPLALHWLVGARGFIDNRIERWTVARDLGAPPLLSAEVPGAASLNVLLAQTHIAPDYAIIARRPA